MSFDFEALNARIKVVVSCTECIRLVINEMYSLKLLCQWQTFIYMWDMGYLEQGNPMMYSVTSG